RSHGRHSLEGPIRAARGCDRRDRGRRQHHGRGRDQEPMSSTSADILLVVVVATALVFDFTNGFHDTANAVAASISTRAMPPRIAVIFAALLNFAGAFISLKVATTIAKGIVSNGQITTTVVFSGLVGAIIWNLITWYRGLPS